MSETSANVVDRGATYLPHLEHAYPKKAAGTINPYRLSSLDSSGNAVQASANSTTVCGVNMSEVVKVAGDTVDIGVGKVILVADDAIGAGRNIKAGDSGRAIGLLDTSVSGATVKTTGAGVAFTNQPANDGIEFLSNNAADTTQTVTIIGTTNGANTVVVETKALNGTSVVSTTKTDWGVVLAIVLSAACAGTVTVREASADQAIASFTAGQTSKGVETVAAADQQTYNVEPTAVADGATTKQLGIKGTNSAGTVIYDSKALNGTTAVTFNSAFKRVTEVYTGDLEAARTATVKVGASTESAVRKVGKALTAAAAQGDRIAALVWP